MIRNVGRTTVIIFALAALGLGVAIAMDWMALGYAVGSMTVVVLFVFGVAHLRAAGHPPEHHQKIDKVLDDTRP